MRYLVEEDLSHLPARPEDGHKGTFGKLLIVAGGENMAGAAILSAKAAYRSGVGLVKVYTSIANRMAILIAVSEAIVITYEKEIVTEQLIKELQWADAVVAGPGLGLSEQSSRTIQTIVEHCEAPVLFDADGLNLLAQNINWFSKIKASCVITPHLGEFSRLTQKNIDYIKSHSHELAMNFAKEHQVICVLKNHNTVIASPQGESYINKSGNNGMATAGSGDVLSGIIGGFLAQGWKTVDAASYGVFIHGLAGDYTRKKTGTYGMMASDIIEGLKEVWNKVENN